MPLSARNFLVKAKRTLGHARKFANVQNLPVAMTMLNFLMRITVEIDLWLIIGSCVSWCTSNLNKRLAGEFVIALMSTLQSDLSKFYQL